MKRKRVPASLDPVLWNWIKAADAHFTAICFIVRVRPAVAGSPVTRTPIAHPWGRVSRGLKGTIARGTGNPAVPMRIVKPGLASVPPAE